MNIAIINLKDIWKILKKIVIVICLVIIIARLFKLLNDNMCLQDGLNNVKVDIKNYSFVECLPISLSIMEYNKANTKNQFLDANKLFLAELSDLKKSVREKEKESIEQLEEENKILDEEENQEILTDVIQVSKDAITETVTEHNITGKYNTTYNKVKINNQTNIELTEDILTPNADIKNKKDILIYHTHTCESYTSSDKYYYEMTGNYRTTDLNFTVAKVGEELAKMLQAKGFNVNHNKTCHDYPSYTGSYDNSLETIRNILCDADTEIVFDIHRDAVGSSNEYAPTVKINDEYAAQIMFVIRNQWRRIRAS